DLVLELELDAAAVNRVHAVQLATAHRADRLCAEARGMIAKLPQARRDGRRRAAGGPAPALIARLSGRLVRLESPRAADDLVERHAAGVGFLHLALGKDDMRALIGAGVHERYFSDLQFRQPVHDINRSRMSRSR